MSTVICTTSKPENCMSLRKARAIRTLPAAPLGGSRSQVSPRDAAACAGVRAVGSKSSWPLFVTGQVLARNARPLPARSPLPARDAAWPVIHNTGELSANLFKALPAKDICHRQGQED